MKYKVCEKCEGYMFNPDQCDKCDYYKERGIFNPYTIKELIKNGYTVDDMLFIIHGLQRKLTDDEVRDICNLYSKEFESLEDANKLFFELDHMNMVMVS